MSIPTISRAALGVIALAPCFAGGHAEASDGIRLSIDWGKLADALNDGALHLPHESPHRDAEKRDRQTPEAPWFGVTPHLSLILRDWGGAQLLVGHLMLTDEMRLSRSCRMIFSRVRLADGRLAPFAQAGFGQWRVDTDLMPIMPADVEIAAQVGGGFELMVNSHAAIALETDYTILYREQHAPEMISGPHPWATFLAGRAVF
jgi:hypothetical protein